MSRYQRERERERETEREREREREGERGVNQCFRERKPLTDCLHENVQTETTTGLESIRRDNSIGRDRKSSFFFSIAVTLKVQPAK